MINLDLNAIAYHENLINLFYQFQVISLNPLNPINRISFDFLFYGGKHLTVKICLFFNVHFSFEVKHSFLNLLHFAFLWLECLKIRKKSVKTKSHPSGKNFILNKITLTIQQQQQNTHNQIIAACNHQWMEKKN